MMAESRSESSIISPTDIATDTSSPEPGWRARLDLIIARRGERSVATRRRHRGPVYVQRPLYPERDGTAHIMLLHPPGGVVQGDEIAFDIELEPSSRALVTTPSAAKLYRSPVRASRQRARLRVGAAAQMEWLPQETIVFDGARAENSLDLDLACDARAIAWDIWTLGRPAANEAFNSGHYDGRLCVRVDDELRWHERTLVPGAGESAFQKARWGLNGARAMGTFIAYRPEGFDETVTADIRRQCAEHDIASGVSAVDGLLIVRATAREARLLQAHCHRLWQSLRPLVLNKSAVVPRIWAT
ncbi:urease accessory protein UreD [Salinisphaera sp.]|uniref:urease accessory protein UreD n=1 Tax=Salinisphaera sp. TaxID=1914330 RepID=UPI003C7AE66A